jgi:hypothetical protein
MTRNPREIERAFKKVRRQDFLLDLKRSWYVWAIIGPLLVGLAYYNATPRTAGEVVYGTAIEAHQPASEDNNKPMMVAVRLDSGRTVTVRLPRGVCICRALGSRSKSPAANGRPTSPPIVS